MKHKQSGFILLLVLTIIAILSFLVITMLQNSIISFKTNQIFLQHIRSRNRAEENLKFAESTIYSNQCNYEKPLVMENKLTWWQKHACQHQQFYFMQEQLYRADCQRLIDQSTHGIVYDRVTVRSMDEGIAHPIILQSVIIREKKSEKICKTITTILRSGRISWRQF